MIEHFFLCPHCFSEVSVLIDPTVQKQEYLEDCEVCTGTMLIHIRIENQELIGFYALKR